VDWWDKSTHHGLTGEPAQGPRQLESRIDSVTEASAPCPGHRDEGKLWNPRSQTFCDQAGHNDHALILEQVYQTSRNALMLEGGQPSEATFRLERASAPPPAVVAITPTPATDAVAAAPEPVPAAPRSEDVERPVSTQPPAEPASERPLLPTAAWVSAGATAAVFLGALITGQLALSAESDFEQAREAARNVAGATPLARRAAFEDALDAADRADGLALASDVFLVAGLVGLGVTAYFTIDHYNSEDRDSAKLTLGPTGIALDGRF